MKSSSINDITELFLRHAVEMNDPDRLVELISNVQTLLVTLFSLYIIMLGKEHQEHDDCDTYKFLPDAILDFKRQLINDLDSHVQGNCLVNNIMLAKSTNEKTYEEIMKTLKQAE